MMLTPTRIVSFRVWGVERFPLVIKGVGLFNLNGSLNLRKIGQLMVECVGSSHIMHGSSTLGPFGTEGN